MSTDIRNNPLLVGVNRTVGGTAAVWLVKLRLATMVGKSAGPGFGLLAFCPEAIAQVTINNSGRARGTLFMEILLISSQASFGQRRDWDYASSWGASQDLRHGHPDR